MKHCTVAFVPIKRALYRLKSSGTAIWAHLLKTLEDIGCQWIKADPDVLINSKVSGFKDCNIVLVYVDDIPCIYINHRSQTLNLNVCYINPRDWLHLIPCIQRLMKGDFARELVSYCKTKVHCTIWCLTLEQKISIMILSITKLWRDSQSLHPFRRFVLARSSSDLESNFMRIPVGLRLTLFNCMLMFNVCFFIFSHITHVVSK